MRVLSVWIIAAGWIFSAHARVPIAIPSAPYLPESPESEYVTDFSRSEYFENGSAPTLDFCAEWNPEFPYNGHHCCTKASYRVSRKNRKRRVDRCSSQRRKTSYCGEMTEEQQSYVETVSSGKADVMQLLQTEMGRNGEQSYCTVNNGFLVNGRPVVPTAENRIQLRNAHRCVNFGTDAMVGMLEWVGHQIAYTYSGADYSGVHLIVGDISAPKGGCLPGRVGRKGHASHTTGQDVDLAFLTVKPNRASAVQFQKQMDAPANWWLMKQVFNNPFACIKVVFLDRSLIRKLAKAARGDPEWLRIGRFIRHARNHKNHYHVRIGSFPGQPGCVPGARPDLEEDDDSGEPDLTPAQELLKAFEAKSDSSGR